MTQKETQAILRALNELELCAQHCLELIETSYGHGTKNSPAGRIRAVRNEIYEIRRSLIKPVEK